MKKNSSNKNAILFLCSAIFCLIIPSCELIFETPLTGEHLELIMPADGIETDISSQTFWWDPVQESKGYNLQIVSPSFDTLLRLVIDTNVTSEKFEYSLYPGKFQWRVRAYNANTSTVYFTRDLTILNTYDLSNQTVVLKLPHVNFVTHDTTISFSWYPLNNATDYRFELKYESWEGSYALNPILTDLNSVTIDLMEGQYAWGVQGQNQNSSSIFSHRTFIVDKTDPATPILESPSDNTVSTDVELTFLWTRPDTTGSDIMDSLYISRDSLFVDTDQMDGYYLVDTELKSDLSELGRYFWRVRSIDAAGNKSPYSVVRRIIRKDEE